MMFFSRKRERLFLNRVNFLISEARSDLTNGFSVCSRCGNEDTTEFMDVVLLLDEVQRALDSYQRKPSAFKRVWYWFYHKRVLVALWLLIIVVTCIYKWFTFRFMGKCS